MWLSLLFSQVVENVVKYLSAYATDYGLPMPAAPRGRDSHSPIYLPASVSKKFVYQQYVSSCSTNNLTSVGLSTFKSIWCQCVPHIRLMEPRSDVCAKCDKYRKLISDSVTEVDKLSNTEQYAAHITIARAGRSFYNKCISDSREELVSYSQHSEVIEGAQPCASNLFCTHYNFDFAQSFCLPHQCLQVGPLYFLSPLKVHCFGICNEGNKKQVNYLFDEGHSIGVDGKKCHGPNNVISMLHHYLSTFGLGEKHAFFHADNCGGQNKNKTVIGYFLWRVAMGLHESISLHFMEPGHTKSMCDACFGKIRQLFRRSDVDTVSQLAEVVNKSANINVAQVCHTDPDFNWCEWDSLLIQFLKPFKGIRKYYHFRFSKESPGSVFVRKHTSDDSEEEISLLRRGITWPPDESLAPNILPPAGLSQERRTYLDNSVKPYVRQAFKDQFLP